MKEIFLRNVQNARSFRVRNLGERFTRSSWFQRTASFIQRRPLGSFFVVLAILFGLIILGSFIGREKTTEQKKTVVTKTVKTFSMGVSPKLTVQAKVDKAGVVKIFAQTAGVVHDIPVQAGDSVKKGATLVSLSSNYQGGNAPALQTAIAQAQYQNVLNTYDTQKDLISKQREIAQKTEENSSELRDISEQSVGQSETLLNHSRDVLATVETNLAALQNNNPNGVNNATILQTQQLRNQVEAGVVQIEGNLRNLRYTTSPTGVPTELAALQKDTTLKQLDVQERALELNKKVSGLQVSLAAINASLMCPTTPFAGTVERILVKEGQLVNPGTQLAVISSNDKSVNLYAQVTRDIAQSVSPIQPSIVHVQGTTFSLSPTYISQEATDGEMYTITYALPEEYSSAVTDAQYVTVDIPLGSSALPSQTTPYIPIDAVFQTQDEAYVNVVMDGKAVSKKIVLGNVYGKYVEVVSGLDKNDQVILDRNILAGDSIKIQ